jgi:puromycin-sensitive aminopeptidase
VSSDQYRLPTTVRPSAYTIRLELDHESETFSGRVVIDAEAASATNEITLNSEELTITAATASQDGATTICDVELDEERERLTLRSQRPFRPGPLTFAIDFHGRCNDQLVGPYVSHFSHADGEPAKLITTQFEATHARKCFPCWDEPAIKASFEIELIIDGDHQAVSNAPEVSRTPLDDGRVAVRFAPTIVMSTYLVAFVAGPIETTQPIDVGGVPLRVVHVPGKGALTDFALEAGAFALGYFTDYFGLPYPGDKLDLVAIPDFAFGAMENLGCVTFREALLLIDPDQATQPELQRAADVINHEIAHMWFGDLVTMSWWNGLWLNEAFATFMEMRCTDAFRPGWDRWTDFGLSRSEAFATDSLASTRPIEYAVISPIDAEGMFDVLTYEKGAAVVRMLEQYLGEDRFRDGIRRYMVQHQFADADTADLWDAIEAETGEPVRRIMESWIFQGGYPQVVVTDGSRSTDGATVELTQHRMRFRGTDRSDDQTWMVPVSYRRIATDSEHHGDRSPAGEPVGPSVERLLLATDPATIEGIDPAHPVVVNSSGSGFYRVLYPDAHRDALAAIAVDHLNPVERYALIDDTWSAVLAGQTTTPSFLTLLEAMTGESDRSVWQRLIAGYSRLRRLVGGEARERLEEITHDALAPALAGLGLSPAPDDDDRRRQLRADLVRGLGVVANDPDIQDEAKRASATGLRNPELVDSSLLAAAIDVVAAGGDEADFDDFTRAWKAATTPQSELRYLGALTDFPDPALVEQVYGLILDGSVRTQNAPFLLRRALLNEHCGRRTWQFITQHWDRLVDTFASSLIVRMVEGINALDTEADREAVAGFFSQHSVPSGQRTLQQILERQRVEVSLRQRESELLSRFLLG